ncbi:hypothetical protein HDV05_002370 [Chytridiales sp. JEL 0842]|nr:hypothetical protein HDV05_002370 [Chytridiales sp. JEL 0842]
MEDDELAAIRARRMAEMRGSSGAIGGMGGAKLPAGLSPAQAPGSEDQAAKKAQMDEMRRTMLAQLLDNEARERLARISIVKPEKARAVEDLLIRMAQTGQIRDKVKESMLIDLLGQLNEQTKAEPTIKSSEAKLEEKGKEMMVGKRLNRQSVAEEVLDSERRYHESLLIIDQVIRHPLLSKADTTDEIISRRSIQEIFGNIDNIIGVTAQLLEMLEERMLDDRNWDAGSGCLGDLFIKLTPFLKIYSFYYSNFSQSLSVISNEMSRNTLFADFLESIPQMPECRGLRFDAFLIMPIQRVPRYKLLLQELLRHTPQTHPDHVPLTKAVELISHVAESLNEKVRQHAMFIEMLYIQRSLVGFKEVLLVPGRNLLHKGLVTKICRKTDQVRQLFLFSDILIYTSPLLRNIMGEEQFLFHRKLPLHLSRVEDVPDTEEFKNMFQIVGPEKSIAMYAGSQAEKQLWISAISGAIRDLNTNRRTLRYHGGEGEGESYQAPIWVPDKAKEGCMVCDTPFSVCTIVGNAELSFAILARQRKCLPCTETA